MSERRFSRDEAQMRGDELHMQIVRYDRFKRGYEGAPYSHFMGDRERKSDDDTPIYDWPALVTDEALEDAQNRKIMFRGGRVHFVNWARERGLSMEDANALSKGIVP